MRIVAKGLFDGSVVSARTKYEGDFFCVGSVLKEGEREKKGYAREFYV